MEAYAIISIQTASPALDFQCLVFLTDELKTQLLRTERFSGVSFGFCRPTRSGACAPLAGVGLCAARRRQSGSAACRC